MTTASRSARPGPRPSRGPVFWLAACLLTGCATIGGDPGQPLIPTRYQTKTGPFVVFTGTPIAPDSPTVRCLNSLERDLGATIGLKGFPEENPVEIYVLRDREAFTHFLTFYFPELPPRRAFFIAQGPRRVVYTFQNDRLEEDLRHEATHALLHLAIGDLPLWLDEGLAEYFEGPEGRQGLNAEHLARLPDDLKAGWRPDLARLEAVKNVREMTPRDYREAWAWVHYLLNEPGPGKAELMTFLGDLRRGPGTPITLSDRLANNDAPPGPQVLAHLERVRTAPAGESPAPVVRSSNRPAEPTILLQNSPVEPARAASKQKSAFGRFLGFFGLGGRPS